MNVALSHVIGTKITLSYNNVISKHLLVTKRLK